MAKRKTSLTDSLVIAAVAIAVFGIGIFLAVDGMETVPKSNPVLIQKSVDGKRIDTIRVLPLFELKGKDTIWTPDSLLVK